MPRSGLPVHPDCFKAYLDLKSKKDVNYNIFKLGEGMAEIVLDESGAADYEVFKEKLLNAKQPNGKSRPSYGIYFVEFDIEGGHRDAVTFISYVDDNNSEMKACMTFASSLESLKNQLDGLQAVVQANDSDDLRWSHILSKASRGQIPDKEAE